MVLHGVGRRIEDGGGHTGVWRRALVVAAADKSVPRVSHLDSAVFTTKCLAIGAVGVRDAVPRAELALTAKPDRDGFRHRRIEGG